MDIAERVNLIVADAVVLAVTVYHTYGTTKASRDANLQATFSSILLRAGRDAFWLHVMIPDTYIHSYMSGFLYFGYVRSVKLTCPFGCTKSRSFSQCDVLHEHS